jgi:uncharacterized protein (TIGR02646 family)
MQGPRCACCEGDLNQLGQHIDHHHPRHRHPQGTFAWDNLLGSCARAESCGHFKDAAHAPAYQLGDLIDPSAEDPDRLLIIRTSGVVDARPGLPDREAQRARRTLAALNLNSGLDARGGRGDGRLVGERKRQLEFYRRQDPDIEQELLEVPEELRDAYIDSELQAVADQPFSSIIRHHLGG